MSTRNSYRLPYPIRVMQSAWRRIRKPSPATIAKLPVVQLPVVPPPVIFEPDENMTPTSTVLAMLGALERIEQLEAALRFVLDSNTSRHSYLSPGAIQTIQTALGISYSTES